MADDARRATAPIDDALRAERAQLRGAARNALGWDAYQRPPRLRSIMQQGPGWYPLAALALLSIVDEIFGFAFTVLAPDISRALGISKTEIAGIISLKLLAVSAATLPVAALVQRHPRRAAISVVTAFAWTAVTFLMAFVIGPWALVLLIVADGLTTGSVRALHQPLLMDTYEPNARVRVLSTYGAGAALGSVIAPLIVAAFASWLDLTWRGVFLAVGVVSLAAALSALRLRDPGFGHTDADRVRALVHDDATPAAATDIDLGFLEIMRRLTAIPTIRRALVAQAVMGVLIVPYSTFLLFFLSERWDMDAPARGVFFAFTSLCAIAGLRWFAPRGERLFARDPALVVRLGAITLASSVVAIVAGALVPKLGLMVLCFGLSAALSATVLPTLATGMLSIVPAPMRPHLTALAGIWLAGVGGFAGALLLGSVDRRFGTAGALVSIAVPGLIGSFVLLGCARTIPDDIEAMLDATLEAEQLRVLIARGAPVPLLACRHVDFAYGSVQVLFDVDFAVDAGRRVALLGTNGAGKSTLLRVIAGLEIPGRGTVRIDGRDVTFTDAERRIGLGVTMVSGGHAVFRGLSVVQNLRVFGQTLGSPRQTNIAVDECLARLPALAARRNVDAATLSGGEQQMLALAKAVLVRPRLLLFDELSLGLAPVVVDDLLATVRALSEEHGTAVVLVEQSVNVALSVAEHAYFLERGRVRYDGPAAELAGRDDLLRAVLLGGGAT